MEQSKAGSFEVGLGHLVLKPLDFEHRTITGPAGAVILSLATTDGPTIPGYQWQAQSALPNLVLSTLRQGTSYQDLAGRLSSIQPSLTGNTRRSSGTSPSAATRRHRAQFGETSTEMNRRIRCQSAAQAIAGGASLGEAALQAGFADQAHFTRTFKRVFGIAPGAYFSLLNDLR